MRYDKLVQTIRDFGYEIVERVKDHQHLDSLEEDMLSRLASLEECGIIISGYHRRTKHTRKNAFVKPNSDSRHVVVMNLLDGEENYFRGNNIYGTSLSLTSISTGEHFAVVYDGLTGQVIEFGGVTTYLGTKETVAPKWRSSQRSEVDRESRLVFGFGRIFSLSKESLAELEEVSTRSLGSTTVSILEVLRGHLDVYLNITKVWNIWWALWLPSHQELRIEDLSNGRMIRDQIPRILSAPDSTIPLLCYRDVAVKKTFSSSLRDFSEYVLRARRGGENGQLLQK